MGAVLAAGMSLGMYSPANAQESDPPVSQAYRVDPRDIELRLSSACDYAVYNRVDDDGSLLPLNDYDRATYDIGFGLHSMGGLDEGAKGLLHDRNNLSFREVNEIKLSMDNVWGMAMRAAGKKTTLDDHVAGRFGIVLMTALGMGATSRWAHEEAGHGLSAAGYGINKPDVIYEGEEGITYRMVVDRWTGGLNNSEDLFFRFHRNAMEDGLDLVDALGLVMSKFDNFIQWSYSNHVHHPSREWVHTYSDAISQAKWARMELDDDVDLHRQGLLGRGDTRDYVTLLGIRHPDASHEKDLYASILSAALSASFWQSAIFTIKYIVNGNESEKLWGIRAGPVDVGLPSVGIYRLADGYFGRARSHISLNDMVLSIQGGVGLHWLGGTVPGYEIGIGLHKLHIPQLDELKLTVQGALHMDGSVVKGYSGMAELRFAITDDIEVFGRINHSVNAITQRPGLGDEDTFITGGIKIHLD